MQQNVQITLYKSFTHNMNLHRNVLRFHFKGGNSYLWALYFLPQADGGYLPLAGHGHIRGAVLNGLREDFGDRDFANYDTIYRRYAEVPGTIIEEKGHYA